MFPDRLIFTYEVRGDKKFADPLAVRRNLMRASLGTFDEIDRDSRDRPAMPDGMGGVIDQGPEDPGAALQREDAREKLHAVVCAAFSLAPFDPATGLGTTEAESTAVLDAFLGWLEGKEKGSENFPGISEPTDTPPDSSSTTTPTSG